MRGDDGRVLRADLHLHSYSMLISEPAAGSVGVLLAPDAAAEPLQ